MTDQTRRNILIGAGLAVAIPAGIYGIPRLREAIGGGPGGADGEIAPPLDADEQKLVAALAEGIIPKTETPGAIGAGVPAFITMMFADWLVPEEQAAFRAGLKSYDEAARTRFGKPFAAARPADQLVLLKEWDHAAAGARAKHEAKLPPFAQFKALTVIGYYTSQVGQEQELGARMDAGQTEPNGPVMMPLPFNV